MQIFHFYHVRNFVFKCRIVKVYIVLTFILTLVNIKYKMLARVFNGLVY